MEGSDFLSGMQQQQNSLVRPRARRIPKIGEPVIAQGGRALREGVIVQVAADRDDEPSRAKFEWRGLFGIKHYSWVSIFEILYPTMSKPDVG